MRVSHARAVAMMVIAMMVIAMMVICVAGVAVGDTDVGARQRVAETPAVATTASGLRQFPTLTAVQAQQLRVIAKGLRAAGARCVAFEQTRHMVGLSHPLMFIGEFSLGTNGSIDWRLQRPLAVEYLFTRNGAWRRTSAVSPWVPLGVSGAASAVTAQVFEALIDLDPDALQRYFMLGYDDMGSDDLGLHEKGSHAKGPHEQGPRLRLQAVPKDPRLRAVVTRAVVQVGRRVELVEIHEATGDWSQYKLAEPRAAASSSAVLTGARDSTDNANGTAASATVAPSGCLPVPTAP